MLCLLSACQAPVQETIISDLPRSTPEAEGVSSQNILSFLESADTSKHEFHSFMFVRHGKVIAEGWWNPYAPGLKHTMYSTSKSFTSTALGFAVSDKLLTVDDKVVSFFPEHAPDSASPYLAQLSVKDLLTMSVGQDPDPTQKVPADSLWVKGFLETPILNEPGTKFLYNSMATYMLSAIVTKVTGEKVIDYLKPRLFDPLNIAGIDWETDPSGVNTGGWGLRLKTEDMAKFGQLLLQNGEWNGQQLISQDWVEEATTSKIIQRPDLSAEEQAKSDWLQGYCYQFWRCRNNAFRGDGAFGQYVIVMPEQDAVIAITSETSDMQGILNMVWDQLLPAMQDEELAADENAVSALSSKLFSLALPQPQPGMANEMEATVAGKSYTMEFNDNGLEKVAFQFGNKGAEVAFTYKDVSYNIPFGSNNWQLAQTTKKGPYLVARAKNALEGLPPFKIATASKWNSKNELELTIRYLESPHTETWFCAFNGDRLEMKQKISFAPNRELPVLQGTAESVSVSAN